MRIGTEARADTGPGGKDEAGRSGGRPSPPPARRQVLRRLHQLAAVLVSVCALLGAVRLVVPATADTDSEPPGVRRQLVFLREGLDDGTGD
ncbi:hypothetical protein [Streptomyces acidicola]|uniref:Uncharacterized protein n=1 Tax=Streptomyces acidicola TaxID=2596892 RepID=A0A5N8WZP1_9ACTN|nr:hypothetical protein [Streptomyces acidicola]MPY52841.1 hypothetical protein [Streptomyces acidicola]